MIYLLTLFVAGLSMVTTLMVMVFYYIYNKENQSRLLAVIVSLIFTDFMVAFLVLVWHIMQSLAKNDSHTLDMMCRVFLPFPIYFFIAGYGFTVIAAWRFLSVSMYGVVEPTLSSQRGDSSSWARMPNSLRRAITLLVPYFWQNPLWGVWYVSLLLVLPLIAMNAAGGFHMTEVVDTPRSTEGQYCFFDSASWAGRLVNNICFQLPLLVTIAANITAFSLGLRALRYSPHSVVAREMNRVGKYLFVLLIVWVPNLLVNLYQEANGAVGSSRYDVVIEVMVFLTSLQGFLNVVVYAWGHTAFKRFIRDSMCCVFAATCCSYCSDLLTGLLPRPPASSSSDQGIGVVYSTTRLNEALNPMPNYDDVPEGRSSTDTLDSTEQEYLRAGFLHRSGRVSDPPPSPLSTPLAAATAHQAVESSVVESVPVTPSPAASRASGHKARVPPNERMLRFSPHAEVKYYDESANDSNII